MHHRATPANRLIDSSDPYLLQHAHNPVDWYPWGDEALEKAQRENKPIFVSVGYATCYWCHVAEREIFADASIAELMNAWFVNIKVDREERPDIDAIYMLATQVMTGHGGWPNNLFLTPDLKPFFAGSYFPPQSRAGQPGFPDILRGLHKAWTEDNARVQATAERVDQAMREAARHAGHGDSRVAMKPGSWLANALQQAVATFDPDHGGFAGGGQTRFPQSPRLTLLQALHEHKHEHEHEHEGDAQALAMLEQTLLAMATGGVMDQLAGGFHRYSTDLTWSVPHFEKMLYDNAQLLGVYAGAWAITGRPLFRQVAERIAHYLLTDMRATEGGFYNALDAETDGIEGASYVWTRDSIEAVLGADDVARLLALHALVPVPAIPASGHEASPGDALRLDHDKARALAQERCLADRIEALTPLRDKLLLARGQRPQPACDEKIVLADNALTILGLVQAGEALHSPDLLEAATATGTWIWNDAFDDDAGLLRHQFYQGRPGNAGMLDDYALVGQAFLTLYKATGDMTWQIRATRVADVMLQRFLRPDGRMASTEQDPRLPLEPPAQGDSERPGGLSAAFVLLLELARTRHEMRYARMAHQAMHKTCAAQVDAMPAAWSSLLAALADPGLATVLQQADKPPTHLPDSTDHVHVTARRQPESPRIDMEVIVRIDSGFHIQAHPAGAPDLTPTRIVVVDMPHAQVTYPPAEQRRTTFAASDLAVYTDVVRLHVHLPREMAGAVTLELTVQACTDSECLLPATMLLSVPALDGQAPSS